MKSQEVYISEVRAFLKERLSPQETQRWLDLGSEFLISCWKQEISSAECARRLNPEVRELLDRFFEALMEEAREK